MEVEAPRGVMPRDIFTSKRLAEYARFHFSPVRFGACHRCEVLLNDFGCSTTAQFRTSLHPFKKTRGEKGRVVLAGVRGGSYERRPYLAGEAALGLEASERGHIVPT